MPYGYLLVPCIIFFSFLQFGLLEFANFGSPFVIEIDGKAQVCTGSGFDFFDHELFRVLDG